MDPADAEKLRQAFSSQENRVGQHEKALLEVMEALTALMTRDVLRSTVSELRHFLFSCRWWLSLFWISSSANTASYLY